MSSYRSPRRRQAQAIAALTRLVETARRIRLPPLWPDMFGERQRIKTADIQEGDPRFFGNRFQIR